MVQRRKPPIHWLEIVAVPRKNSWAKACKKSRFSMVQSTRPIHPMTRLLVRRPGCDTDRADMFRAKQNNSIVVRKRVNAD